jgi:predicted outer membrane protein
MKTLFSVILVLVAASSTAAGQEADSTPTPKPNLAVCKADLKIWSADKTETLSIDQIFERMNMMVACGDAAKKAKKKDKEVLSYLYEFYRTHAELGNRTLDFIKRHDLSAQFREEENGVSGAQSSEKH